MKTTRSNSLIDIELIPKLMTNQFSPRGLGEREVHGGLAVCDWYHIVIPWGVDTDKMVKFIETQTEGRYSIQAFAVRFELEKDAVIFKLGFGF